VTDCVRRLGHERDRCRRPARDGGCSAAASCARWAEPAALIRAAKARAGAENDGLNWPHCDHGPGPVQAIVFMGHLGWDTASCRWPTSSPSLVSPRMRSCKAAVQPVVNTHRGAIEAGAPERGPKSCPRPGRHAPSGSGWPGGATPLWNRWKVRMPGCIGEWKHHRCGRSSRRSLPKDGARFGDARGSTPQGINETAFRRV
jgi:hypothetical protein